MAKKSSYPRFTTPVGVAIYPHLTVADTKFDAAGVFSVKVRFSPGDVTNFVEAADKLAKEKLAEVIKEKPKLSKVAKLATSPFKPELDDDGDETGDLVANFKMKAKVEKKDKTGFMNFKPALFDAAGKPTKAEPWSGTKMKVNFEMVPYFAEKDKEAGVSLRLYAVQIIELVTGGNRDAESFGFGVEEGGWQDETDSTATTDDEGSDKTTATDAPTDDQNTDF